jgi:hypothetical protein
MVSVIQTYQSLEKWVLNRSRLGYSIAIGFASSIGVLLASLIFEDITISIVFLMGIVSTIVYYVFDLR